MKTRKVQYDQTAIVEFYNDDYDAIDNKDDIASIQYNATMLLNKYYPGPIKPKKKVYSLMGKPEIYPDLSGLTELSCLYVVGHSDIDEHTFAGCDAETFAERLVEDAQLKNVKRIVLVACDLGLSDTFIPDVQSCLAKAGIYAEVGGYKGNLIITHDGKRMVDLGEEDGHVKAGLQKRVYGWSVKQDGTRDLVILSDTSELNDDNEDDFDIGLSDTLDEGIVETHADTITSPSKNNGSSQQSTQYLLSSSIFSGAQNGMKKRDLTDKTHPESKRIKLDHEQPSHNTDSTPASFKNL